MAEDPQKKIEFANKTLNRLIAGDFLESLGKELGLEVPPDVPYSESKESGTSARKESKTADNGDKDMEQVVNYRSSADNAVGGSSMVPEMSQTSLQGITPGLGSNYKDENSDSINLHTNGRKVTEAGTFERSGNDNVEHATEEERKTKTPTHQHQNWNSGSSEDERSRNRSHHGRRRSYSDSETTDSFDDSRKYSRSKGKRKRSSREKSSSRRHSKHHKHRYKASPERNSHYDTEKERRRAKDRRKYNE